VRGKAAARLEPFMERARELLRAAGGIYADETPARTAGGLGSPAPARNACMTPARSHSQSSSPMSGCLPGPAMAQSRLYAR
jgi:hypothetical protein